MRSAALVCAVLICTRVGSAHGILGNRFFPPTISTDDPFAVDEFAFPTVSWIKNAGDGGPSNHEVDAGFEFDKEILPHFAMGVSDTFIWQKPKDGSSIYGWDNLALTTKYQIWQSAEHETIFSIGLEADIGGTGSRRIGRDSFSTIAPRFLFGKGMGDLPDSLSPFRPLAFTGALAQTFPLSSQNPNTFDYGVAIEYSLQYLQQNVQDIGLPEPFKNMIPLVEFTFSTPENRASKGLTTGTINPGVLWETNWFQLGAEANIPVNGRSGAHVGITVQMWIYIDDIFPRTFGHPLFGDHP
jgi:hypothetical protein